MEGVTQVNIRSSRAATRMMPIVSVHWLRLNLTHGEELFNFESRSDLG